MINRRLVDENARLISTHIFAQARSIVDISDRENNIHLPIDIVDRKETSIMLMASRERRN